MKIILMMAVTVDGRIAQRPDQNADWTSKADKKAFVSETKKHGAIIMGENTFKAMGQKSLPGRFNLILSLEPENYKDKALPGQLEFFNGDPADVIRLLEDKNYQSAILGGGAKTNASFLKAGLVDEILITVEPRLFGVGINFTEGAELNTELELIEAKEIGDNAIQLRYKIKK